ncbi:MAG: DNA-binding protein [Pseudomonadota bacterium]
MRAPQAAAYLGIGTTKLRDLDLPRRVMGGCVVYDRVDLDAFADGLPYEDQDDAAGDAWDAVLGA